MNVIAFAHLTIVIGSGDANFPFGQLQTHKFLNVENAREKFKIMKGQSQLHDIYLVDQDIPIEFVKYKPEAPSQKKIPAEHESTIVGSTIHSQSFDDTFFRELRELLKVEKDLKMDSYSFRTLNLGRSVELRNSKSAPKFNQFIDESGMSSIALYVSNISDLPSNFKSIPAFELSLGSNRYKITFVECGKVWVELIERLSKSS